MTNETQATLKGPMWKQALLMLGGGVVLGCGGCAGFNYGLLTFGILGFVFGVAMVISGLIGLVVAFVRAIAQSGRR
jgi:hypothetical protein